MTQKLDFIRDIIAKDLATGKHPAPITRFPPEPNGYLHIGHAKAIYLNFSIAEQYAPQGAYCNLRFDDTNPEKEETRYVQSIQEDINWLGFQWHDKALFASNYFDFFYQCALSLIEKGLAYVDEETPEDIKAHRGNVTTPGTPSPFRERPIEESLLLFKEMKAGEHPDGAMVLRAKIDLSSSNMNMRDPILYRIMHAEHHNTGKKWCIYPMYDFAHPLEDALEGITHSLCSLEFENHRPLYEWVIEHCPVPHTPRQIEFSRLNLSYTVMSKRKLLTLVNENHVDGWDDPRLPTLSGMRRRGYPAESIRSFCQSIGITKFNSVTDFSQLEDEVRSTLNPTAPRRMAVLSPLKLTITNWEDDNPLFPSEVTVSNNPAQPNAGERRVRLGKEIYIEHSDFMEDAPKSFFRLSIGRSVRLRGGFIITCQSVKKDAQGEITELLCSAIPDTIGKNPPEGVKCKAAIHWVEATSAKKASIYLYDRLFMEENPDAAPEGFLSCINPHSLEITTALCEASIEEAKEGDVFQFERVGYFCCAHKQGEALRFNRTVALRNTWKS